MKHALFLLFALCSVCSAPGRSPLPGRQRIPLGGVWQSSLGPCRLPGTTDESRLGPGCSDTTATHQLTRLYPYSGCVEYSRVIELPASFAGRRLVLYMERTKPSVLLVDGDSIGCCGHLYAPHRYYLPPLAPGKHTLRIRIDNSPESVPAEIQGSHAWSDATQTNWNGITGDFYLEALPAAEIRAVQVYPDPDNRQALAVLRIFAEQAGRASLRLSGRAWNSPEQRTIDPVERSVRLQEGENRIEILLDMGSDPLLWSEFHPALYRLVAELRTPRAADRREIDFGMRKFETQGNRFLLNGHRIFLRGKHDACVFPLTGYAPTDVETWREVFRTARSYGINHYRCHSYAPPHAALAAADIEGIYFQPELPLWGAIEPENTALNGFLLREAEMLLDEFGNHPSFLMLGLGNELGGDVDLMRSWLERFRQRDSRHLYCFGANNFLGWKGPLDGEDFLVTCRVGGGDGYSTHVRSSFAYVDAEKGGLLNNTPPNTLLDYSAAIARSPRPVIGHETGQFQIYPDYGQIDRYTGVLHPCNLKIFRRRLAENGLADQAEAFHRASGRFAVACYKADIEYALRTPELGGFQMLDLQDYPGQGSALVGILDAFMQSKGLVDPETFRGFCGPVVPLVRTAAFCLRDDEPLHAEILLSNYTEAQWESPVVWRIAADDGSWERSGSLPARVAQGSVGTVGCIDLPPTAVGRAVRLQLTLTTGEHENRYAFWVYPAGRDDNGEILVADRLDEDLLRRLDAGACVLFVPKHEQIAAQSVGGLFTPDYWNYAMFKTISENAGREVSPGTLSILTDPSHPLLRMFPTEEHSDWQWWRIVRNARPLILDRLPGYRPLVQVIDNIERNHRLGLVFEFAVGEGRLLVSMCDLEAVAGSPEGDHFRNALLRYMKSDAFRPAVRIGGEELIGLFRGDIRTREITGVENASDYTRTE